MPKMNWNDVDSRDDGAFERLEPGGYVAVVTAVEPSRSGQAEKLIIDIAEGDRKGYYENDKYNIDNAFYLSWKNDTALKYAKGRLEKFQQSNPGFDPFAAFDADRWELFLGKRVGIVVRDREYEKNDGTIGTGMEIDQVITVDDVHAGNFKIPPTHKLDSDATPETGSTASTGQGTYYDPCA